MKTPEEYMRVMQNDLRPGDLFSCEYKSHIMCMCIAKIDHVMYFIHVPNGKDGDRTVFAKHRAVRLTTPLEYRLYSR